MESGYSESTESWAGVLWAALDEVFPTTEHQRCWDHRVLNVQA